MKILIIGGKGTIGKKVVNFFEEGHEVVTAGRKSGMLQVDMADSNSIRALFEQTGPVDAVIVTAGEARWAPMDELSEEDFYIGIHNKMMGQVNIVRLGKSFIRKGGSITLTTGILGERPVPMTTSAALVNGAIHSFVRAFKQDFPEGPRLNVVAPGLVEDAYEKYKNYFPGHSPVSMADVVAAYEKSVYSDLHGELIRVYE